MLRTEDIKQKFKKLLKNEEFVTDKSGVKTLEIMGATFIADKTSIFGETNWDWVEREKVWYNSQSLNVNDIPPPIPAIWKQVATPDGEINSNYGWCIYSNENHNQYLNTLVELQMNPNSRRAVMIYTRPTMWNDFNREGMSDYLCTNTVQYLIRDNKVNAIIQMRSNDAVYGYRGDMPWQSHVLDRLVLGLNSQPENDYTKGDIIWHVGSLHVYERHFELVENE